MPEGGVGESTSSSVMDGGHVGVVEERTSPMDATTTTPEPDAATQATEADATQDGQDAAQSSVELDPVLKHVAKRAGISEEDIAALGDSATTVLQKLKRSQDEVSARLGQIGRTLAGDRAPDGQAALDAMLRLPQQAPGVGQAIAQQTAGGAQQQSANPLLKPLELGEVDSELYGDLKDKVLAPVVEYVNALREQIAPLVQYVQQQSIRQVVQFADEFFDSLGDVYADTYGKGSLMAMNQNSKEYQARMRVLQWADWIHRGAAQAGQPMTPMEAMQRALSILSPELSEEAVRREISEKLKSRSTQAIGRPSGREHAMEDRGDSQAVEAYREAASRLGLL